MPTVAVSSQISEAVYFVAIFGLFVLLARPVQLVYSASQERSAQVVASGLQSMIDSMSPGTTLVTSLETYPGVQTSVTFLGTTVTAAFGGSTAAVQVEWRLPHVTLYPGQVYNLTLKGESWRLRRHAMVEDYIEVCVALLVLSSTTLLALSVVLSHIALGG